MGKGGIPDRWLPYSAMGSVVPGTCFIACKVPLKDALLRTLPEKQRFGPKELMRTFPKLGLLIDLTNTTRYYTKEDFTTEGIQYKKIFCPGRVIPPTSIVKEFYIAVDNFLDEFKGSDPLIAVHCTHGVNRTGYFICRYMIEKMNIPPEDAVKRFQQARGHNIERKPYVDDLKNGCKGGSEANLKRVPYHAKNDIIDWRCEPRIEPRKRNFNMEESSSVRNNLNYNCSKLNRTHIEDTDGIYSDDRKNDKLLFEKPDAFGRGGYKKKRQWRQDSGSSYHRPNSVNPQLQQDGPFNVHHDSDRYESIPCHFKPNYLGYRNPQPGIFKSKQTNYSDNSKSQADNNAPTSLNSCTDYERTKNQNSEEYYSANSWRSVGFKERSDRPRHYNHVDSQSYSLQKPPPNSFSTNRPNYQPRFQRPPPCSNPPQVQQHTYQSRNRVWNRPSQPTGGPISQHQTQSKPELLKSVHTQLSLPGEKNDQTQPFSHACQLFKKYKQKDQRDVRSDFRTS